MKRHPYQKYDWHDWTAWQKLADVDFARVPATPGAYVLSAGRAVSRALALDPQGFLDIGETGKGGETLQRRLSKFCGCATTPGKTGHMAGWRYGFFCLSRSFPYDSLRIRWVQTNTKKEAHAYEGRVMLTYMLRHGELPPLNYKFNWSAFGDDAWLTIDHFIEATMQRRTKRSLAKEMSRRSPNRKA